MWFMYGAHILYGASKFAAPGALTNVRNNFSAGGPAGRDAHVFFFVLLRTAKFTPTSYMPTQTDGTRRNLLCQTDRRRLRLTFSCVRSNKSKGTRLIRMAATSIPATAIQHRKKYLSRKDKLNLRQTNGKKTHPRKRGAHRPCGFTCTKKLVSKRTKTSGGLKSTRKRGK